jgi:hypothetical protein
VKFDSSATQPFLVFPETAQRVKYIGERLADLVTPSALRHHDRSEYYSASSGETGWAPM